MWRAAAAPESGAGSWEAAVNEECTLHWAHSAKSMAGAMANMYIGSKKKYGIFPRHS
jgi:hypothetical protein